MKKTDIQRMILEEIENVKWGREPIDEVIESSDEQEIRKIIRNEVASIFFTLFKKRQVWDA